jgi:hypothetical protein
MAEWLGRMGFQPGADREFDRRGNTQSLRSESSSDAVQAVELRLQSPANLAEVLVCDRFDELTESISDS